jgi:hypothetical protein
VAGAGAVAAVEETRKIRLRRALDSWITQRVLEAEAKRKELTSQQLLALGGVREYGGAERCEECRGVSGAVCTTCILGSPYGSRDDYRSVESKQAPTRSASDGGEYRENCNGLFLARK